MTKKIDLAALYRQIVVAAWRTAWNHKHLWLFGFFATFASFGGIYEVLIRAQNSIIEGLPAATWMESPFYLMPGAALFRAMVAFSANPILTVTLFLMIVAMVFAVFIWVIVVAIGAIIGSVDKIRRGGDADFAEGVRLGVASFWRLLGINALAKIAIGAAVILTSTNLFALVRDQSLTGGGFFLLSFILFLALTVVVSVVAVYASMFSALNGSPIQEAIAGGWKMFVANWLVSLEMAVMLLLVNAAVTLAAILGLLIVSVPAIFLFMLAAASGSTAFILTLTSAFAVILLTVLIIYGAFMTTFQIAGWTYFWNELIGKRPEPRLQRLANWLADRLSRKS